MAANYLSSTETTNFARLSRLVVDICCDLLRSVLEAKLPPPGLKAILQSQRVHLCNNQILEYRQRQFLYPSGGGVFSGTLEDLDFSFMYRLVRNLQGINIPQHQNGWGRTPDNADRTLSANIDRLRVQRNEAYGHLSTASLSDSDFNDRWDIIRQCVFEIEKDALTGDIYVKAVDALLTMSMDPDTENDYIEELEKHYTADLEVKAIAREIKDDHKFMATDISDVATRQDVMATDISAIATRQKDMATSQQTISRNIHNIREIHPKLAALIETTHAMVKEEKKKRLIFTKGFHDAREKLQKNRVVVIKGNTGDGKTCTAIQLLHWLSEEQHDRQLVELPNIKYLDLLTPNLKIVTFVDDIFGEKDLREKEVQEWNKRIKCVLPRLCGDIQTEANFLVITIRNEVFSSLKKCSLETLFTDKNIIDLSSDSYKIEEEKRELLELYQPKDSTFSWTEKEKEMILMCAPNIGFPQCCQLFCNSAELQKDRVRFFEKPFQFLNTALSKLQECSAILFLFLNEGVIRVKDLDPNSEKVNEKVYKKMLEEAFDINLIGGKNYSTTLNDKKKVGFVKESLDRLLGFLVVKEKRLSGYEVYRFYHDSIYVAVSLLYGEKTPIGYIRNCPRKSLSYITTSKTSPNMIVISSERYTDMCERLLREFECEENDYGTSIGSLDVWKDRVFVERFVSLLNDRKVDQFAVLNKACSYGAVECALYLLCRCVKSDKDTPWWSLITGGYRYGGKGDVDVLRKVVIYLNDEIKLAVLNKACESGSEECALYLLYEGAKPDKDSPWWSLVTAGKYGSKGDVDVLRKVVIYLNEEVKLAVLNEACESGSEECALYLLCEGVKPDKDTPWWSLITRGMYRFGKGDVDVLRKVVIYLNEEVKLAVLNKACESGSEKCALYLLCEGVTPDKETPFCVVRGGVKVLKSIANYLNDETKLAVLNKARVSGEEESALYLLSDGVKPDKDTSSWWWSLITGGGEDGDKGDVDVLRKVVIYLNDEIKLAVLNNACESGSEECALYLLCEGVKPDKDTPWWSLVTAGKYGGKGDVDVLRKVVIYLNEEVKLAVLNEACESGSEECALYLLCEGVKPDKYTPWWSLITGGEDGDKGDVDVLRKVVIYLNDEMRLAVLNNACKSGAEECALYLLCEGVKPNKDTPFCVVKGGCVDVLREILQYDVTPTARNDENNNVLHKACWWEREEMVTMLCDTYAHLVHDNNNKWGLTPLLVAAMTENCSIFHTVERTALKSLCRVEDDQHKCETVDGRVVHVRCVCAQYMSQLVDDDGMTVLHWSCVFGHRQLCTFLYETFPALSTIVDKRSRHCLHYIAETSDVDMFTECETHVKQYLESTGREYDITTILTSDGVSVLDMAKYRGTKNNPLYHHLQPLLPNNYLL